MDKNVLVYWHINFTFCIGAKIYYIYFNLKIY